MSVNAALVPEPMGAATSRNDLYPSFCEAMRAFAPFETAPHIAVGYSGGGDSVALLHLACRWARDQGARITALTVDHGLRDGSRREAEEVGADARRQGAAHHILTWDSPKPQTGIQAAARDARYRLMDGWCRDNHVLHLLAGHSLDDQAETFLMRQRRKSGPVGLAGMSRSAALAHCRLLRPLLTETRVDLRRYLAAQPLDWVEDPSNRDQKFERVQWRQHLAAGTIAPAEVAARSRAYGVMRISESQTLAKKMAAAVVMHPLAYATVALDLCAELPAELGARLVARVTTSIGGRPYGPSVAKLVPLVGTAPADRPQSLTLGGCRLVRKDDSLRVTRERRNLPPPRRVRAGDQVYWDRRFRMTLGEGVSDACGAVLLRPLEDRDWRQLKAERATGGRLPWSRDVCHSLPVLADEQGLFAVPHLGYRRGKTEERQKSAGEIVRFLSFSPLNSLSGSGFSVA